MRWRRSMTVVVVLAIAAVALVSVSSVGDVIRPLRDGNSPVAWWVLAFCLVGVVGNSDSDRGDPRDEITRLTRKVERLEAGAEDVDFSIERNDEIGRLYQAVDEMVDAIRTRERRPRNECAAVSADRVVTVLDAEGTLRRWNEELREVTGYSDEELASMRAPEFFEFFEEVDEEAVTTITEAALETGRTTFEAALQTEDGTSIPAEFVAHALVGSDEDGGEDGDGRRNETSEVAVVGTDTARNVRELTPRENEAYRRELYYITSDTSLDSDEKIQRLLELGCERLDTENGLVTRIDEETGRYEIHTVYGSDFVRAGEETDLSETFCRKTISSDDILGIYNAVEEGWETDPGHEQWGIGCYVGGKILVDDDLYGTLCFVDREPHDEPFTQAEKAFVDLMSRWVSHVFERRERTQELRLKDRAMEAAPVGITITDPQREDNPIVYANDGFERVTGYAPADCLGRNCRFLQGAETDPEPVAEMREAIDAEEPVSVELRNYRKDGTEFWNRVSIAPVENDVGEVTNFVGFQEDVTERAVRERELQRSERRFEAVFDDPKMLVALLEPDGTLRQINQTALEYVDSDRDGVIGEPFPSTPWWKDTPAEDVRQWIERAAAGEYVDYEAHLDSPDDSRHWVNGTFRPVTNEAGDVVSIVVSARDVTKREEYERELERQASLLDSLFERVPVNLYVKDREGRHVRTSTPYLNDDYPDDEEWFRGKTDADIYPEAFAEETYADDMYVVEEGEPIIEKEEFNRDGEEWVLTSKVPWRDDDGEIRGLIGVSQPITEQKERQRDLRETKRQLELALEGTNTGVWEWDLETDEITWNETLERMMGLELGAFEGHFDAFRRRVHPDDWPNVEAAIEQSIEDSELYQTEFRMRHEDGSWVWVEARGRIVDDDGGRRMVGILIDVTKRKERERQLREHEQELERHTEYTDDILDAVDDVFYVLDEDGFLQRWNESLSEVTGYTDEEIAEMHALDFFDEDEQSRIADAIADVFETGNTRIESAFLTKRGDRVPYEFVAVALEDPNGNPVLAGVGRDISERVEKQQQLQERERELRRYKVFTEDVLDTIDDVFYLLDENWNVQRWNESLQAVTGYTDEEVAEMNALDFFDEDDAERIAAALDDIESLAGEPLEASILTKDGRSIPFEFVAAPLEDPEGNQVVAGIGRDISERKEAERRLSTLIDNIPGLVYRATNDPAWPTEFVSEGIHEITGYDSEDLESGAVNWGEDVIVGENERVWEQVQTALEDQEPFRVTYPIETADGERRWVEEQGRGVFTEDGSLDALEGVVIDVTERIANEQELERTRDLLEQAQRLAQVGGWELDLTTEPPEMTWTDELYRLHDLPTDAEVDVESALERYHPDDRAYIQDRFRAATEDGESYDMEVRVTGEDDYRWARALGEPVFEDGEVVKLRGSVQDVTERKERERELERTTDLLRRIQRMAQVGGWELDMRSEPPEAMWTEELYRLHDLPRDAEIDLETIVSCYHPDDRRRVRQSIEASFETETGYDIEARLLTESGDTRWVRAIGDAIHEDGELVAFRGSIQDISAQKERELALRSLHEATRGLLHTQTESDVANLVTETAEEVLDTPSVGIYLLEPEAKTLEPVAYTNGFADGGDVPSVTVGDSDSILWSVFVNGTQTVVDDAEADSHSPLFGDDAEGGLVAPISDYGVFVVRTPPSTIDDETRRLIETLVATTEAAFDRLESEANLRERDAELEEQNRRLRRQIQINEIIRSVDQSLIGATSREEIEETVCERLVENEDVAFAWIGDVDVAGTELVPRSWAGTNQEYLDAVSFDVDDSSVASEPAVTAAQTERSAVIENVVDDLRRDAWRKRALASDFSSCLSVPLSIDEYSYGVLSVYASEPHTFGDLERMVFEELGESIANAITAVKTRQALHADTLLELTLEFDAAETFLGRIARETDCHVEYEGIATHSTDETRLFFTTRGCESDTVRAALDDLLSVTEYNLITASDAEKGEDEECLFEAVVSGTTVASKLVRHGASPRSIRATEAVLEVVVDVPTETDVREFVEMLEEQHPSVELTGRRDVERTTHTRRELLTSLFEGLTDRQLEVLRTAYFAGFFEWPRESTGEEIADLLGVTQPTVNRHLRLGQKRLLSQLFEGEEQVALEV